MANYAMRKHSFGEFVTKLKLCYNFPNYNIAKLFSLLLPYLGMKIGLSQVV